MAPLVLVALLTLGATDPEVERGLHLYRQLEFDRAVVTLGRALVQAELSGADRIEALGTLACAYVILDDPIHAEESFRRVLELEPSYALPASSSPRLSNALAHARERWLADRLSGGRTETETASSACAAESCKEPPGLPAPQPLAVEEEAPSASLGWIWIAVAGAVLAGSAVAMLAVTGGGAPPGTLGRLKLP